MAIQNIPEKIRFFINPLPLSAVLVMAVNDHWLKFQYGNAFTGKLSDFCGVFYFPIFLLALVVTAGELFHRKPIRVGWSITLAAIFFTDFLLILVKLSAPSARMIEAFFSSYVFPIRLVQDPTDLVALAMNPVTYFYLRSYWAGSKLT